MTTGPLPMPADRPTRRANALPSWVVCPPGPLFWIGTAVAILLALDANTLRSFGGLIVALQAWGS